MEQPNTSSGLGGLLQATLLDRQSRRPGYSLRAFARQLAISAPALSEILKGKRRVSKAMAHRLVQKLCLDPVSQQNVLADLFDQTKTEKFRPQSRRHRQRLQLQMDQFHLISDWHHFAILSLTETRDFCADPIWIAGRLGVTETLAAESLERLVRLGCLKRDRRGRYKQSSPGVVTSDNIANLSVRKAHYQNLDLARRSLDEDPVSLRDFTAITMAIDPEKLAEANAMIRTFRDRLCRFLESGEKTEVYRMCMHLFPLSKGHTQGALS